MRTADLVTAWEHGHGRTPAARGLLLVGLLGTSGGDGLALSVGQRDALLLDLRAALFGAEVDALASCPACGERLELDFDVEALRVAPPGDPTVVVAVDVDGYRVQVRPPTTGDLAALDAPGAATRERLLGRCVTDVRHDGRPVAVAELPDRVRARVVAAMAQADPQADVRLALHCPECGDPWNAVFDIVAFLWQELDAWARRLVGEVHVLASTYGWAEADILAMSPWRRSLYLKMAQR